MPAQKKQNKDREKDKALEFVLVLYPENEAHSLAYLKLTSPQYSALGIFHDKDVYPEDVLDEETGELKHKAGDLKKEHYHFYIKFRNQRYINGLAKELGIESHLIEFLDWSFKNYAEYMLHWGKYATAGRYVYDVEDFEGTLKGFAKEKLINEDKNLTLFKISNYIDSLQGIVYYTDVYKWAFAQGYASVCTGRINVVKTLVEDHNSKIYRANEMNRTR